MKGCRGWVVALVGFVAVGVGCPTPTPPEKPPEVSKDKGKTPPSGQDQAAARVAELMAAAGKGDISRLRELLQDGIALDVRDENGDTVLMKAAETGQVGLVQALLIRGLPIGQKNRKGETALIKAAGNGQAEVVQLLVHGSNREIANEVLEAIGVDPAKLSGQVQFPMASLEDRDELGQTALMKAEAAGHVEVMMVLAGRESLTRPDANGVTPLMKAASGGNVRLIRGLLALNRENWFRNAQLGGRSLLDQKDRDGKTPLQRAEEGQHADAVAVLKEYAAVNARDADGRTPLLTAALKGDEQAVRELLGKGADLAVRDGQGQTALMLAAAKGHADVVNALLGSLTETGTNQTRINPGGQYIGPEPAEHARQKDNQGKTAVDLAKQAGHQAVLTVFKAYSVE
jgi:ankyrin repeat protein